jgi:hypothetical protein
MRTTLLTLCALLAGGVPLAAQTAVAPPVLTLSERIRLASLLPIRTAEWRDAGVADTTVSRVLDLFRVHRVDPVQVDAILVAERDAAREHGPTDNFGAFVQRQLAAGKRGRALSDAIRAEHRVHGHKNGSQGRKEKAKDVKPDESRPEYKDLPDRPRSDPDRRPN